KPEHLQAQRTLLEADPNEKGEETEVAVPKCGDRPGIGGEGGLPLREIHEAHLRLRPDVCRDNAGKNGKKQDDQECSHEALVFTTAAPVWIGEVAAAYDEPQAAARAAGEIQDCSCQRSLNIALSLILSSRWTRGDRCLPHGSATI